MTDVQTQTTNTNAIIALVLGILSLVIPWVGFILGIIAIVYYVKAKKAIKVTNEKGNGMALAGLICGIIGILAQILIILSFIFFIFLAAAGY
ncbi:DUF4190 domain-containing protein [Pseudogracilibacillus sp. SE30717A]|uniref:DUF4190 domain-containing protein n=1 Tax=Pseudogracilibacillus sp. SE30717A TaxID=3098293 RepID=UPI00300DD119